MKEKAMQRLGTIHQAYYQRNKEIVINVINDLFENKEIDTTRYSIQAIAYVKKILKLENIKIYEEKNIIKLI